MTMTRFVPFRAGLNDVAILQNRLNSIFTDFARPFGDAQPATESLATGNFVPAVDVYEDAQHLTLQLEVPGIPHANLDIHIEGRTLTVKGERKFAADQKEENFHRVERRFGSFIRSFTLPSTVDTEQVSAATADGILSISLAKKPEAKPRQIAVQIAPTQNAPAQNAAKQVEATV